MKNMRKALDRLHGRRIDVLGNLYGHNLFFQLLHSLLYQGPGCKRRNSQRGSDQLRWYFNFVLYTTATMECNKWFLNCHCLTDIIHCKGGCSQSIILRISLRGQWNTFLYRVYSMKRKIAPPDICICNFFLAINVWMTKYKWVLKLFKAKHKVGLGARHICRRLTVCNGH